MPPGPRRGCAPRPGSPRGQHRVLFASSPNPEAPDSQPSTGDSEDPAQPQEGAAGVPWVWPVAWSPFGVPPEPLEPGPACAHLWRLSLGSQGLVGPSLSSAMLARSPCPFVTSTCAELRKHRQAPVVRQRLLHRHPRFLVPRGYQDTSRAFCKPSSLSRLVLLCHLPQT